MRCIVGVDSISPLREHVPIPIPHSTTPHVAMLYTCTLIVLFLLSQHTQTVYAHFPAHIPHTPTLLGIGSSKVIKRRRQAVGLLDDSEQPGTSTLTPEDSLWWQLRTVLVQSVGTLAYMIPPNPTAAPTPPNANIRNPSAGVSQKFLRQKELASYFEGLFPNQILRYRSLYA